MYEVSRKPSPKRMQALRIWLNSGRKKRLKEIAEELDVSDNQIRQWKHIDRWDEIPETIPNKRGAPFRNKNAIGNNGGAPTGNQNAVKHGMYMKWMPNDEELKQIYESVREGMNTLDILYEEILVMFTNFIRAQKIMYVRDQDDTTKILKKRKSDGDYLEEEYEIQFAWDKQAKALTSQAAAMRAIGSKIKQYEELLRTLPPEEIKETHRLRVSKLKADIDAVKAKAW